MWLTLALTLLFSIAGGYIYEKLEFHPRDGGTDDPNALVQSMIDLGATVSVRFDVITVPQGTMYGWVVDITKEFPDKTVWHNESTGLNLLSTLQTALNSLVSEIQNWKAQNPGY